MNKIILLTGMMVGYAYSMEFFIAWYSGNEYETICLYQPGVWSVCVGLLDHDVL